MKTPAIKTLVENFDLQTLQEAEARILEGENPGITIVGDDEGEQLTHVSAAIWILEQMNASGVSFQNALREFMQKVRGSIS
jgi:hypothetical protein